VTADGDNEQHKIHNSRNEYSILDNVDMEKIAQTPTQEEVVKYIMKLKNNKAPEDNIVPEMIKCGGEILNRRIYELMCRIWEKEEIPDRWRMGIICPIFKKGDQFTCSNYINIMNLGWSFMCCSLTTNKHSTALIELKSLL
jgi:hypothetical protein